MPEEGRPDITYIFDRSKDTTGKSAADRVTLKLNEYMQGYAAAGQILLELYDGLSYNLFARMEQDLPEMRGKWVEYVYRKYCMSIPWEFKLGLENGTLIDNLLKDSEWNKAFPKFKRRVIAWRKAVEEQKKQPAQESVSSDQE